MERPCKFCGRPCTQRTKPKNFCSRLCCDRMRRKEQGWQPSPHMWRTADPQPCRVCGKPTEYRYCSAACCGRWYYMNEKGADPISLQPPPMDQLDIRAEVRWQLIERSKA